MVLGFTHGWKPAFRFCRKCGRFYHGECCDTYLPEATSEREARKLLDVFSAEVQKGLYIKPSKLTLKDFAERWVREYVEVELAPKTAHRYKECLARAVEAMGHLKLEQVKPLHLVEFYNSLRKEGARRDGRPGKLSEASVLYHHRVISSLFSHAVKWGLLSMNPASKVDPPKTKRKEPEAYDHEQTARLLATLEPLKYKVLVVLALATGLRRGELLGLEWHDVDFENCTIEVRQASQYLPERGVFTKEPKTETSRRIISVPSSVMELLKQYRAHQAEERLKVGDLWEKSGRLFTTWNGRPMHPDTATSWFAEFLERHGLPRMKFQAIQALRHTSVCHAAHCRRNIA
ncbi:MAG: tyrosine-type recombinase/integrase [Clostridia bacterium]|jgi:integrase|nr:site-specific integrase [Clostridia bacterium]MDH7572129.1 tyrosine-type recombinase/integrase [Clostridia bacterium]